MCIQFSLGLHEGEDVGLAQDEQILPVDLDLGPAVLAVEHLVALLDVKRDAFAVVVELAVAGGEDLALLRLLLGGVGKDQPTGRGLLLLDRPHDQAIAQGLELHVENLHLDKNATVIPPAARALLSRGGALALSCKTAKDHRSMYRNPAHLHVLLAVLPATAMVHAPRG